MGRKNRLIEHFDRRAHSYDQASTTGIWQYWRQQEWQALQSLLPVNGPFDILDAGAGSGFYSSKLKDLGHRITAIDISPRMVESLNLKGIDATCTAIAHFHSHQRFDLVLALGVLEFSQDIEHDLKVLSQHVKPNGTLLVLCPKDSWTGYLYWLWHRIHRTPIQRIRPDELSHCLSKLGFKEVGRNRDPQLSEVMSFRRSAN